MPNERSPIYWDACACLSYVNEMAARLPVLDALLAASSSDNGNIKLYTSAITKVEVSFGATEQKNKALDDEIEGRIDKLWTAPGAFVTVAYHDGIGREARNLIRTAITNGWSLKPLDAIHLATIKWLIRVGIQVKEFQTYDQALFKYDQIVGCTIREPYIQEPKLF